MHIDELIKKSRAGDVLSGEELVYLLSLAPDSVETYMVMAEATRLSKELSGGKAEVHAQFETGSSLLLTLDAQSAVLTER